MCMTIWDSRLSTAWRVKSIPYCLICVLCCFSVFYLDVVDSHLLLSCFLLVGLARGAATTQHRHWSNPVWWLTLLRFESQALLPGLPSSGAAWQFGVRDVVVLHTFAFGFFLINHPSTPQREPLALVERDSKFQNNSVCPSHRPYLHNQWSSLSFVIDDEIGLFFPKTNKRVQF